MEARITTLTAFLDLAVCPVSYDAVVFMVKAEMERRRIGAERMHVVIVGEVRKKPQYDEHEAHWRLWNIVIPACQLFNATVTLAADWLQAKRIASDKEWKCWPPDWDHQTLKDRRHLIGDVIAAANMGVEIPRVQASEHARRKVRDWWGDSPVVTMTLRNTYLWQRNTDAAAWGAACRHITERGYRVEILQDTDTALCSGHGYGEFNLDLRASCYAEAALNLQANNGAASLCWFGLTPYVMFGAGVPGEEWRGLFVEQGLPLGKSWPWAGVNQKICYGVPTSKQIINEFEEWRTSVSVTN